MIRDAILADPSLQTGGGPSHDRGKPTDPELLGEEALVSKEIDQGSAYFQLQHMLCTELSDSLRFPLKIKNCLLFPLDQENAPGKLIWQPIPENNVGRAPQSPVNEDFYRAALGSPELFKYTHKIMYVDPAGGGQGISNGTLDETAYCVLYYCNGYIFVMDIGALPGGYDEAVFAELSAIYNRWGVKQAYVERNYGAGALAAMWKQTDPSVAVEDDHVTGQKELRICDTLEPLMAKHRIIFNDNLPELDVKLSQKYPTEKRSVYQMFFQMQKITRDRDALIHDDRLDALAGGAKVLMDLMSVSEQVAIAKVQVERFNQMMSDPLGNGRPTNTFNNRSTNKTMTSVMQRYRK
jgi:hypothetical protein